VIERQLQRGPLVQQGEAGEAIVCPDQQRDASTLLPVALEPRVGEAALGIDLAIRAADGCEFREVVLVELQQALEHRLLRGGRLHYRHGSDQVVPGDGHRWLAQAAGGYFKRRSHIVKIFDQVSSAASVS